LTSIAGGAFSQFPGVIAGRNIELVANQRIVQAGRPTHWDTGNYSVVHFEIKPHAAELSLISDHICFPAAAGHPIRQGRLRAA
jgi:hypothetical protein